ncbi:MULTISPECIES: carbonic anhydrase [Pseudomonadaceae]|uniref:carbonic anhydrase n=1 Tax=Pseudomonas denitrificans TaxID=43306 RepID=A0A9X7R7W8_PSEDE|nr:MULTISPECIES: carbonic anhydrase family protein [Pseudomonadaceae]MBD9514376.1 carbonic anhydrase family protein [Pseudomonas sp. PDM22]OQR27485.1 carbonic anhydrase [Pseudomonas sp. T]QEY75175.1 carbonic anhydrase family protein [Pseudomonas denitrificans (nom. rej.)]
MRLIPRITYLLAPLCLALSTAHATDAHWSYSGDQGPAHWGEEGSALCAKGTEQSPINVEKSKVEPKKAPSTDLALHYSKTPLKLINNGHTIQASIEGGDTLIYKGTEYQLLQFHFHTPSEHQFNHQSYPMEMHLVNQDKNGHLLVLGLMIKQGQANKQLAQLWKQLPAKEGEEAAITAKLAPNLAKLLPTSSHHLFYHGSLTTPPCTEGVQWVLFENPIEMSKQQIEQFHKLFPDNHRPTQTATGREVDED